MCEYTRVCIVHINMYEALRARITKLVIGLTKRSRSKPSYSYSICIAIVKKNSTGTCKNHDKKINKLPDPRLQRLHIIHYVLQTPDSQTYKILKDGQQRGDISGENPLI